MMQISEFEFEPEALEVRRQTLDNRSKKIYKKKSKESPSNTARNIDELSSQGYYAKAEGKAFDSPTSSAQSYSTSDVTPFLKAGKSRKLRSKLNSFRLNTYQRISLKKKKQPTLNQIFQHFDSFNPSIKDKLLSVPVNKISPVVIDQLIDEMPLGEEMSNHEAQLQKIKMLSQAQERDLELFMNNQIKETEDSQKYRDYLTYMTFRNYYCQKSQELIADKKTLMLLENSPCPVVTKVLSPEKQILVPLVLNTSSSPKQEALAPSPVLVHGSPFYKAPSQPITIANNAADALKIVNTQISCPQIQHQASDENSFILTQQKLINLPKYVNNVKEQHQHSGAEANNFEGYNWQSPLIFKHRANTALTDSETTVDSVRRGSNIWSEQFDTVPVVNNKAEIEASNDYFRKRVFSSNKLEDITDLLIDDDEKIYDNEKLFSLSDEFSQNNSQPPIKEIDMSHERNLERGLCTIINERMIAYDI